MHKLFKILFVGEKNIIFNTKKRSIKIAATKISTLDKDKDKVTRTRDASPTVLDHTSESNKHFSQAGFVWLPFCANTNHITIPQIEILSESVQFQNVTDLSNKYLEKSQIKVI